VFKRGLSILEKEGQDTAFYAGIVRSARLACEVNGAVRPSAAGITVPARTRAARRKPRGR